MKAYSTKANAKRAAKSQGLDVENLVFVETEGGFVWEQVDVTQVESQTEEPTVDQFIANQEQIADKIANNAVLEDPISPVGNVETFPHQSTVLKPCKQVFYIADEMKATNPNATRSEIINECVKRGIAFYTARTQYQHWYSVQKEMAEREANSKKSK